MQFVLYAPERLTCLDHHYNSTTPLHTFSMLLITYQVKFTLLSCCSLLFCPWGLIFLEIPSTLTGCVTISISETLFLNVSSIWNIGFFYVPLENFFSPFKFTLKCHHHSSSEFSEHMVCALSVAVTISRVPLIVFLRRS